MIIKIVSLFLIAMVVLGMFGKLRLPKPPKRGDAIPTAKKCKRCGTFLVTDAPCSCDKNS